MKKNLLMQAALATVFSMATSSAFAVVNLDPAVASTPVKFATELSAANVTLTNVGGNLSLSFKPAWGVSAGNHLYVRVDLTNAKFKTALAAANMTSGTAGATISLSSGGGVGQTSVIYDVSSTAGVLLSDVLTLAPADLTYVNPAAPATVKVNVYDTASLAFAGANGLGYTLNDNYVTVTPALTTTYTPATNTAGVASSFKKFLANATTGTLADATTIQLGKVLTAVNAGVLAPATGVAVVAADLATASDLVVTGLFSATGAAGIFAANVADCSVVGAAMVKNAGNTTATATGFAGVTLVPANPFICMTVNGTTPVPAQTVTGALTFTGVLAGATVAPASGTIGTILHDGTELQTPWFSTATGYVSRMFLTNTGTTAANISGYTVLTESGNTCTAGTGAPTSIPANSMIEVPAISLCSAFSGATRAAVVVTIEQPTTQIQGVYQIINPTTGAQMAYPMMRPGTN